MGGMTRREMLKASAVAGGVVWASPFLSTGIAWGADAATGCACDGATVYAKFAPGNSQTCQNQCLQPGDATRYNFKCLVDADLIRACDDVDSSSSKASLEFLAGTRPLKLAIKTTNDCYVTRCNEGFSRIYKWSSSFNTESYPDEPRDDPPGNGPLFYNALKHNFKDPATSAATAMFVTYKEGDVAPGICKGNLDASLHQLPTGVICGTTYRPPADPDADPPVLACTAATAADGCQGTPCTDLITGVFLSTDPVSTTLNFIEMELCITNTSKIPCLPIDCKANPTTEL